MNSTAPATRGRRPAPADEPQRDRSAALDGARGLAALSVLVFHGWLYSRAEVSAGARASTLDYALHELRLGLVLFFVLSGFLLWRPFLAAARGRRPRPGLREYAVRRAGRVVPAYYAALVGSVVLLWGAAGTPGVRLPPAEMLPWFLVFGQNLHPETVMKLDPPMWTLAVEATFYALVPLVALAALRLGRARAVQALVPLALLGFGVWWNHRIAGGESIVAGKALPAMLPYFAVGMLAAVALDGRPRLGARTAWALLLAGAALVVGDALWQAHGAASRSPSYAFRIWRDLPAAAGFALVVAVAARSAGAGTALLRWRPVAALGTISYGLYLWHVPLLLAARHLGVLPLQALPATLVALALSLPVAAASWRWIERPAIERSAAWSRRWRADRRGAGARRPGAVATEGRAGG